MMAESSWVKNCLIGLSSAVSPSEMWKTMGAIMNQLKSQPILAAEILEHLYHPIATKLLHHLSRTDNEDFILCAVQCMDEILNALCDIELRGIQIEVLGEIGGTLLHLHYSSSKQLDSAKNNTLILLASLSLLSKITTRCPNFAQTHISEILGIAKANVSFGLETINITTPQKILPMQNLPYDSSAEELDCENAEIKANARRSGGGRVPKKRKPRSLAKSMQNIHQNPQQTRFQTVTFEHIVSDIRTSDSDASELENNAADNTFPRSFSAHERQKHARVRQMAIALIGTVVTRLQERRILYGYWHAFFENTKIPTNESKRIRRSDLLHIGLHDPNNRCRATALQIAGQLIFGSKNFLQQAECVIERLPTAFLPFAHSLGLQVVSMFEELTQVLVNESSLLVLTQALKCLAVLVQASTPFERFHPRDFVGSFITEVQRLVLHRDETVQVAALMVLEFLITTPALTPAVAGAIGASHQIRKDARKQRSNNENEQDFNENKNSFDEYIESESEDDTSVVSKLVEQNYKFPGTDTNELTTPRQDTSWLLQYVLRNLGVDPFECGRKKSISSTNSVRIESLQVLSAMAQHFSLLESQMDQVLIAIQNALVDPQPDLRFCGARCLDTIVYQIGRTLLENTTKANLMPTPTQNNCSQLEEECLIFWSNILPTIMAHISSSTPDMAPTSTKVCLCDVLSNMGVVVFERQSYAVQMNLIGFLSGIACDLNEDATVRCAAVRALAVYVLFPSLRGNLVFVENAAELTLRLIGDTNILVRVKAHWALGNISDALLLNNSNAMDVIQMPERISDDLLWRLISAATEACNDNDKVRCNAVRTLGNLLRLLEPIHFKMQSSVSNDTDSLFKCAIIKLLDCLRSNASAKVKWNTCYAIGNLLQNGTLLSCGKINNNFDWQSKLYSALANVIVKHPNFKVRINAATALTRVTTRAHFGVHYEIVWKSLLKAIEQSHHLDNFYEYNHRDNLQEQLCLAMSHMMHCAVSEDFLVLQKHLEECAEIVRNTWLRVTNRMVPEKSAPLIGCTAFLQQQLKNTNANLTMEQRNAIVSIIPLFESQ